MTFPKQSTFLLFFVLFSQWVWAQQSQVIRGTILDKQSELPLIGVAVELISVEPMQGTTTDENGRFSLPKVPLGRHNLRISYLGYNSITIPNVVVNAGKEVNLDLQLEEVTRFSGGRNDVARLVGKDKRNSFTLDTKVTTAGGRYYTPVDLEASKIAGEEVLLETLAFSERFTPYFRFDFKVGFLKNSKTRRFSQQFFLDFQNLTNRENIFQKRYNDLTNEVNDVYQSGFFPDILYRVQF